MIREPANDRAHVRVALRQAQGDTMWRMLLLDYDCKAAKICLSYGMVQQ